MIFLVPLTIISVNSESNLGSVLPLPSCHTLLRGRRWEVLGYFTDIIKTFSWEPRSCQQVSVEGGKEWPRGLSTTLIGQCNLWLVGRGTSSLNYTWTMGNHWNWSSPSRADLTCPINMFFEGLPYLRVLISLDALLGTLITTSLAVFLCIT